jgi:CDP-diglyceride synthetase
MFTLLAQALFFVAPFVLAGVVHIVVIKFDLLKSLARIPLDASATINGQPVFGKNKTLRGVATMIISATLFIVLEGIAARHSSSVARLSVVDFNLIRPLPWGVLLGVGCVLGELPNSFLKRRLNIAPGGEAESGFLKLFFWIMDQIDSLLGVLVVASFQWTPSLSMLIVLLAIAMLIHPLGAFVMVRLGLKRNVGSITW